MSYGMTPLTRGIRRALLSNKKVWTPAALFAAGEQGVWYDPSDFSSMFQDSAGTTPVTAVGQPVGKILDKSGHGKHASQATTTARPTLQQDSSGNYYLSYDGVDDRLGTASIDFTATDKITVFAGYYANTENAQQALISMGAFTGAQPGSFEIDTAVGVNIDALLLNGSTYAYTQYVAAPAVRNVITASYDIAQAQIASEATLRRNGVPLTPSQTVNPSAGTGNFANLPLTLGARSSAQTPFPGRMYQIIVRGVLSSASEIVNAERFVGRKTGVAL